MSDRGVFGYMGADLNCYQAWCWRWGHDFDDEVCKRCGDPTPGPMTETVERSDLLSLINTAVGRGAKPGDSLTVEDGQGRVSIVTFGETTPAPGRKMLVAVAVEQS